MNFKNAIKTCLKDKYANFKGRASRSEFWFFYLFILIGYAISFIFITISLNFFFIVFGILVLGVVIPSFAVAVRRLHDVNKSGWFVLLPLPFELVEGILERSSEDVAGFSLVFTLIALGLYIYLFVLYCTGGERKNNRFGKNIYKGKRK
tara:strand:+ start:21 stop:467 length:447 start_codon:yes stop_codon:yes gene_type:complete